MSGTPAKSPALPPMRKRIGTKAGKHEETPASVSSVGGAEANPAVPVQRFRLKVAYDGGNYAGWQTQKTGLGVQQVLQEALAKLFRGRPGVRSSSRTDTGVHALGMVVDFALPVGQCRMTMHKLPLAINAHLPPDIRVLEAATCAPDFHPRFQAVAKQYRYFLWCHPAMNPLLRTQAWHVPSVLDFSAMRTAAAGFLGEHDFKSFAATRSYEPESTVRTIRRCDLRRRGPLITFIIEGNGFLYKMCRGIVGTLVQVGQGKIPAAAIGDILRQGDRRVGGMTAPAHGLVLWKVFYPGRRARAAQSHGTHARGPV
jgi:tRNA pseudouridine38-40 synthase